MKKINLLFWVFCLSFISYAQEEVYIINNDSIEKTFTYQHGVIELPNGVAKLNVPKGFKFLDAKQSERLLVEVWGNPKSDNMSLGMLMPEASKVMDGDSYVFNIQYDEIGYVKDDDADEIDYDELFTTMKKEGEEENKERAAAGYQTVLMIGWASKPYYDSDKKILHWAKELKFGEDEVNTLNYNIRILGRKGVLVLNAIATMNELPLVKKDINNVLSIVEFNEGYKYANFDSSTDEIAAWTIGGLVAGKVLAKVGFFAILLKFGKFIFIGLLALFGGFRNKIKGWFSKKEPEENTTKPVLEEVASIDEEAAE